MLKIAFVGVGSIAQRHIKNLSEILKERKISYQIDIIRSGKGKELPEDIKDLIKSQYTLYDELQKDYDIFFITNPTSLHFDTIKKYITYTKHMFIEKPIFDKYEIDLSQIDFNKDGIYYVACPLRYTNVLQYIKSNIDFSTVISARAISSSYLPDWRKGIDYRNTYSAKKELGGGVSIDLIHEWDYLTSFFGFPNEVKSIIGKFSNLEITSDDLASYIGVYNDKVVELHLDYFGRYTVRKLELYTTEDLIVADIQNSNIRYEKENRIIDLKEERNNYQKKELEYFLDMVQGKVKNSNDIENALKVLKLAKKGEI